MYLSSKQLSSKRTCRWNKYRQNVPVNETNVGKLYLSTKQMSANCTCRRNKCRQTTCRRNNCLQNLLVDETSVDKNVSFDEMSCQQNVFVDEMDVDKMYLLTKRVSTKCTCRRNKLSTIWLSTKWTRPILMLSPCCTGLQGTLSVVVSRHWEA